MEILARESSKLSLCQRCLGADINAKDNNGETPLHSAADAGHADIIRALVELGADINAQDEDGETPLHRARENENSEAVQTLLELGAKESA